jgi:hypothetical protein
LDVLLLDLVFDSGHDLFKVVVVAH